MIRELLTYFKTHASKEARVFGHLYESISLIEREVRCHKFWLSHRTNCKNTISENINLAKKKNKILVLGSGPLHEIPLDKLSAMFKQVDLVDIVHLSETKKSNAHYKNVHFIEADITELEKDLLKEKKALSIVPKQFISDGYDFVISANLMSQLAYHLRKYLDKKANPKLSQYDLDLFANEVTYNHFLYLKQFTCPVLLITDIETDILDIHEKVVDSHTPYIDFPLPPPIKEWWWNVAPIPEYSKSESLKMKVAAFLINL